MENTFLHENITVKFRNNEFGTIAQTYSSESTIGQVMKDIASKFKVSSKHVSVKIAENDQRLSTKAKLNEICRDEFGIVDLELNLSDAAIEFNQNVEGSEQIKFDADVYYRYASIISEFRIFLKTFSLQSLSVA